VRGDVEEEVMTEREWEQLNEALTSLRDEPLEEAALAEVRGRVRTRIRRTRRGWWIAFGSAAAAVLFGVMLWPPPERPLRPPEFAGANVVLAPVAQIAPPSPVKRPKRRKPAEPPPEPMKIQMLTDDPDIVIVWLVGD
jgi:hypothetical protein